VGKLPVLSGAELVSLLEKNGFLVVRQKGSHTSLRKDLYRTVVPLHDELAKGTLHAILKQCGLSREELEKMTRK
jgi:predicted RNA binding protein YcfA (HicA-like mRNA interferase family)